MAKDNDTLKAVTIVAGTTVISRLCGFLRDMTYYSSMGISDVFGAFLLAFSFPNMFRRLLGEGALSSAIVPVLSKQYVAHGRDAMFGLFNRLLWKLSIILVGTLSMAYAAVIVVGRLVVGDKWGLVIGFTALLLPYMVFVCLAAVVSAALNVLGKFFIPSINQVWMNLTMILSLLIGRYCFKVQGLQIVHCLIGGVLVGGALQLFIPLLTMFALGWRPGLGTDIPDLQASMATLRRTFLPGIAGACIEQVNILISRLVAYWLVPSAVPLLYLAARLTELPNGVFGASITTVFFPNMAKIVGEGSKGKKAGETFLGCMVAMVWIMVPSAIGLFILRREILLVFFQHGDFTATDAIRVLPIIGIYCVGMVFSSLAALCVRGFHSFGDMKTPAFVGAAVLIANAILSLTLGGIYGVHGVATATTVATILQVLCLVASMEHRIPMPSLADRIGDCRTLLCGNVAVFLIAAATKHVVQSFYSLDSRTGAVLAIVFAASLSPLAYLVVSRKMLMGRFTASGAEHHGKPS